MDRKSCGKVVVISSRGSFTLGLSIFIAFHPPYLIDMRLVKNQPQPDSVGFNISEGLRDQLDSIKTPFNKCVERLLDHIELDEYFAAFYQWTVSVSIPVIVLSAGITSMIHAVLAKLLGPEAENIEVIANEVVPREGFRSIDEEGGAWKIEFRDDSSYGHDKARTIRPYAISRDCMKGGVRPLLLFAGDGVSDLSAAKETELLFAKEGEGEFRSPSNSAV